MSGWGREGRRGDMVEGLNQREGTGGNGGKKRGPGWACFRYVREIVEGERDKIYNPTFGVERRSQTSGVSILPYKVPRHSRREPNPSSTANDALPQIASPTRSVNSVPR